MKAEVHSVSLAAGTGTLPGIVRIPKAEERGEERIRKEGKEDSREYATSVESGDILPSFARM